MPGSTNNLDLFLPDAGQSGVAAQLNTNWSTLDNRFDEASGHTHDGTAGEGPPIAVTSIAAIGVPDATKFLRGDGQWAAGAGGGAGVTDHGELTGLTDDDHPQYANQARGDARYLQRGSNLSDVTNTTTARTNLSAAAASHVHAGADITSGTVATARLGSGTASTSTFLRGDQTWATPAGGSGSTTLDDLTDVLITTPADDQVLTYDSTSSSWRNETPAAGLTTEQVQDIVAAEIVAGTGVTATYDDTVGTVTIAATGGGGAVATDPIWDATGDLAVGSGANTAAKLPKGSEGDYLTVSAAGLLLWAKGGGTTAVRPAGASRVLYHRYFDTTLGKLIAWDGTKWRDGAGADMGGDAPAIITSNLIFALAFAEGSGQTVAAANGTSYGAVLGDTSSAEGTDPDWVTAGLDFVPGSSDRVTAAGVPDSGWLGAMTVMVVAKIDTGSAYRMLLTKNGSTGFATNPVEFRTTNAASPDLVFIRANSGPKTWNGPAVTLGAYRCYAATATADIAVAPTMYVGAAATTGTGGLDSGVPGAPTGTGAAVVIGRRPDGAVQMDGVISYVLVYDRILSGAEIATNYGALQAIMAARGVTLP